MSAAAHVDDGLAVTEFDGYDAFGAGDLLQSDLSDSEDDLFASGELADLEEVDDWDALGDELEADEAAVDDGLDALSDVDDFDLLDADDDFALDAASGLYVPERPALITGPAAVALARQLNPSVLEALDGDEADEFFKKMFRSVKRVASRVGKGLSRVGQVVRRAAGPLAKVAGPLLKRALPMLQKVAGFAGPWGRLVSAGIGAARGLASGKGLKGALAGAAGGLIPGIGGRLASSLLGGDGADDDAALDALADMADAGEIDAAVALPTGAGLAARLAIRRGLATGPGAVPGGLRSADRLAWKQARRIQRIMLLAARAARGTTGQRLRLLKTIGRLAALLLRKQRITRGPGTALRCAPRAAKLAARKVVARVRRNPVIGRSTPTAARRRILVRKRIMRAVPVGAAFKGRGQLSLGG